MTLAKAVNPFAIGCYALISPKAGLANTQGVGCIGKIVFTGADQESLQVILELSIDKLTSHSVYAIMPTDFLLPMPAAYVEEFTPRGLKSAYRLSELGAKLAAADEFPTTAASFGVAD